MATMKLINCREHGGTFKIPSRRGRPPVRCAPDNPCLTRVNGEMVPAYGEQDKKAPNAQRPTARRNRRMAEEARQRGTEPAAPVVVAEAPVRAPRARTRQNPSAALAMEAKTLLEAQEWTCAGKAWAEGERLAPAASLVATRGEELITLLWINGTLTDQRYSLWNTSKPSMNGKPASELPFDPDEVPDRELAQLLSGMKVTWWNRIGRSEEKAIMPDRNIKVQHVFNGKGDEVPGERIVTFVSQDGTGFHSFRVDALIRIGEK